MGIRNGKQFKDVKGEMIGRVEFGEVNPECNTQLFQVKLDELGRDDGGAFHGHGLPLFCLRNRDCQHFVRAENRKAALRLFRERWPGLVLRVRRGDRVIKPPKAITGRGRTVYRGDRTIHTMT